MVLFILIIILRNYLMEDKNSELSGSKFSQI
jgi:hypothetical protein